VLIRSGNNPALVAAWLAATKAGAVVVNTMPMLRAGELTKIVDKAEIALALTDSRIADELVACAKTSRFLKQVVNFDGVEPDARLDRVALNKPVRFEAVKKPAATMCAARIHLGHHGRAERDHAFPRDLLIVADSYAREVLSGHAGRCLRRRSASPSPSASAARDLSTAVRCDRDVAGRNAAPPDWSRSSETYKATICITSPTAYRAMMVAMDNGADLSSLRLVVSAGETLPAPVFEVDRQDRQADPRRHRRHGIAAHLHQQPRR
jgi:2-aminobenzoate-CoA ligase